MSTADPILERTQKVQNAARELGFDACGIADARVALDEEFARYEQFIHAGMHGEMAYLADHREARCRVDGNTMVPGAKSVVCVAMRYPNDKGGEEESVRAHSARYARGRDYHNFLRKRLRKLAARIDALASEDEAIASRVFCDTAPVFERAWAARSGLGFVGKNGLLIIPGVGSLLLLGEVVTPLELVPGAPIQERCGSCTRCLDVCPTNAFTKPFVLDPRRCISYLTIELREPIPLELRAPMGEHLFGCDDCQTICPFNASEKRVTPTDPGFDPLDIWSTTKLASLLAVDEDGFRQMTEGTPLRRPGRAGLLRNAAIVLGNRAAASDTDATGALAALTLAAAKDESEMVREACCWAIERIKAKQENESGRGEP